MSPVCQACGRTARTRFTTLRRNVGALVVRFPSRLDGELCRRCILGRGASMTLVTLAVGWLGTLSLFIAPYVVVTNLATMLGALRMRRDGETENEELEFSCAWCGAGLRRRAHGRASLGRCPRCKQSFEVSVSGDTCRVLSCEAPEAPGDRDEARDPGSDHYAVLGVSRDADAGAIRKAYLRLIRRHTPEDDPDAFRRVTRAHHVLSDPSRREEYDGSEHLPEEVDRRVRGLLEAMSGDPAYEEAEALLADHGAFETVQMAAGTAILRTGRPARALQVLSVLVAARPRSAPYARLLAVAQFESGRERRALAQAARALELDPDDADGHLTLARLHHRRGDPDEALAVLDRKIRRDGAAGVRIVPLFMERILILGRLRDYHGMHVAARETFAAAPGDDPDERAFLAGHFRSLAETFQEMGLPHLAKFSVDMALRATPDDGELRAASAGLRRASRMHVQSEEAIADDAVSGWIRGLLVARVTTMTEREWEDWARARIADVSERASAACREEWRSFARRYPDAAAGAEDLWRDVRREASRLRRTARGRVAGGAR